MSWWLVALNAGTFVIASCAARLPIAEILITLVVILVTLLPMTVRRNRLVLDGDAAQPGTFAWQAFANVSRVFRSCAWWLVYLFATAGQENAQRIVVYVIAGLVALWLVVFLSVMVVALVQFSRTKTTSGV